MEHPSTIISHFCTLEVNIVLGRFCVQMWLSFFSLWSISSCYSCPLKSDNIINLSVKFAVFNLPLTALIFPSFIETVLLRAEGFIGIVARDTFLDPATEEEKNQILSIYIHLQNMILTCFAFAFLDLFLILYVFMASLTKEPSSARKRKMSVRKKHVCTSLLLLQTER